MSSSLYEVLGVAPTASVETIHDAYRAMARAEHPDAVGATEETQARMARINEAWRVLGDQQLRDIYDRDNGFAVRGEWSGRDELDGDGPIPPSSPIPAIIALGAAFGAISIAVGFAGSARGAVVFGALLLVAAAMVWAYQVVSSMRPRQRD